MHPYKLALAASSALVASTSLSFATVVQQTATFSGRTDWGTTSTTTAFSPTHTLAFAGFNPSLGTLNSISIIVDGSVTGSVNLTNNGTSTTSVNANLSNTLKYFFPTATTHSLTVPSNSYSQSLAAAASSGSHPVSGSGSVTNYVFSNFGSFESAWDVTVGDLGQVTVGSGNGNGSATYVDTGAVTFYADYNYTPAAPPPPPPPVGTPEPATLTILGAGLTGLGLLRRRRKSS